MCDLEKELAALGNARTCVNCNLRKLLNHSEGIDKIMSYTHIYERKNILCIITRESPTKLGATW
jgi:hypothetical protein